MVMAFKGHLGIRPFPKHAPGRRSKEALAMRRESSSTQVPSLRLRFEPNRLALEYLADAYQRLVPFSQWKLSGESDPHLLTRTQAEPQRKEAA